MKRNTKALRQKAPHRGAFAPSALLVALASGGTLTLPLLAQDEGSPPASPPPAASPPTEEAPATSTDKREKDAPKKKSPESPAEAAPAPKPGGVPPPAKPTEKAAAPKPGPAAKPRPQPEPGSQPRPAPRPTPRSAPPAPPPPPKPSAAPRAAVEPEERTQWHDRLDALRADIDKAMSQPKPDGRQLESLCTAWQSKRLHDLDPLLEARLKLCAGRGALLSGKERLGLERLEAAARLASSRSLPGAQELEAHARYLIAERKAAHALAYERCGTLLGLDGLRRFESGEQARLIDAAIAAHRAVIDAHRGHWATRSLLAIADLSFAFYRRSARSRPATYRGIKLPSPVAVDEVDAALVVETHMGKGSTWPREVRRLYKTVRRQARREGETEIVKAAESRLKELDTLKPLPSEKVSSPLTSTVPMGAIRYRPEPAAAGSDRRFQVRTSEGTWDRLDDKTALQRLRAQIAAAATLVGSEEEKGGKDAAPAPLPLSAAYAAVALAEAGETVEPAGLVAALKDPALNTRLLVLRAMEAQPHMEYYEPLVGHLGALVRQRGRDRDAFDKRFQTLQASLFGEDERTLLALRSVVARERQLVTRVTYEDSLPWDERAWLIAELGDNRARYRAQELISVGDDRAGAIALYATHRTVGARSTWLLRQHSRNRMGCVASHLLRIEEERSRRLQLEPTAANGVP